MQDQINTYLTALSQCAVEEVSANGGLCFGGITVGSSFISMSGVGDCEGDGDDACGEMWVRVVSMYPSTITGVADTGLVNCQTGLGLDIEVGVLRCFVMAEDGEAPTGEELAEANIISMNDAAAIYRAIVCCEHFPDLVLGPWSPLGPDGGLVGGVWTMSVSLY